MLELEIGFVDGGEINSDKPFLQFNVKKNYMQRVNLNNLEEHLTRNVEYWTLLASTVIIYCYHNVNFQLHISIFE